MSINLTKPVNKQVVEQKKQAAVSVINATHNTSGGKFDNTPRDYFLPDRNVFKKTDNEKAMLKQMKKQFKSGNTKLID